MRTHYPTDAHKYGNSIIKAQSPVNFLEPGCAGIYQSIDKHYIASNLYILVVHIFFSVVNVMKCTILKHCKLTFLLNSLALSFQHLIRFIYCFEWANIAYVFIIDVSCIPKPAKKSSANKARRSWHYDSFTEQSLKRRGFHTHNSFWHANLKHWYNGIFCLYGLKV